MAELSGHGGKERVAYDYGNMKVKNIHYHYKSQEGLRNSFFNKNMKPTVFSFCTLSSYRSSIWNVPHKLMVWTLGTQLMVLFGKGCDLWKVECPWKKWGWAVSFVACNPTSCPICGPNLWNYTNLCPKSPIWLSIPLPPKLNKTVN